MGKTGEIVVKGAWSQAEDGQAVAKGVAGWARRLRSGEPLLWWSGWAYFALAALFVLLMPWDTRRILGLNPWVKPLKFALSIGLYLWTVGWFLGHLKPRGAVRVLRWVFWATMLLEIVPISLQSLRGVTSHFNESTGFDSALFGVMGFSIMLNTLGAIVLLVMFLRPRWLQAPILSKKSYLWGVRLGLLLFLVGSVVGGVMASSMRHAIGVPDGGPGLPLLNWSTQGGDLRIAHFLGIHALQVLPLLGWWLGRKATKGASTYKLVLAALLYTLLVGGLFLQAWWGLPLWRL